MDKWYIMHAIVDALKKYEFHGDISIACYGDTIMVAIISSECALAVSRAISIQQLNMSNVESKTLVDMQIKHIVDDMITSINERKNDND